MLEKLIAACAALHFTELWAVLFGVAYVVLAARNSVWCWVFGLLSALLWSYATFYLYGLWIDAILQLFYAVMAVVGWWQWSSDEQGQELKISSKPFGVHLRYILLPGLVLSLVIGFLFGTYTPAASTYLDSLSTVFSVVATFLVIRRLIENWFYWIVVDVIYIYIYIQQGAWLFTALMILYIIIAVVGWLKWNAQMEASIRQGE